MPPVAKKTTTPKAKKKSKAESSPVESPAIYPELTTEICVGENSLTAERVRELLGVEEETDENKFGTDFLFALPSSGRKIRFTKNAHNRPFTLRTAESYAQSILKRQWKYNAQPMTFGRSGNGVSAQHRGAGLLLAVDQWNTHRNRWEENWPTEPTLDTLLAFGVEEDLKTLNTLDTGRARTLADVFYLSPYFASYGAKDRKEVARMADYAIRMMWKRTGAGSQDAFCPYRTHEESLDFLDRHPRLLEAVKHIHEENAEGKIGKFISPGTAAALFCLMAASETDVDVYRNESPAPSEKSIAFKHWDKAQEFWVLFGSGNLLEVRHAIAALSNEDGNGTASLAEKIAVFALAWAAFRESGDVAAHDLKLKYQTDSEGFRHLIEHPEFGGIDLGEEQAEPEDEGDGEAAGIVATVATDEPEPTPEEIEAAKEAIREENRLKLLGMWTEKVEGKAEATPEPDETQAEKPAKKPRRKKTEPVVIEH